MLSGKLRRKVPPYVVMFLDQRQLWSLLGMGLCLLSLYGPLIGHDPDHNGLRYLLGPFVYPLPSLVFYLVNHFSPYRGPAARLARMVDMDKYDADAKRLVEIFQSVDADRVLLRVTILLSVALFIIMALVAYIFRSSLNWSPVSPWQAYGLAGGCIGSLLVIGTQYVVWGLKTWAAE
jgi:hypothetical protein